MDVKTITPDGFFRVFTACQGDPKTLILDVRSSKEYARKHVMQAYNIRLAASGAALLDYSKNTYDLAWSKDCWWDRPVVVYGAAGLKKDHPVVQFLARDDHAKTLAIYREGFEAFERLYPFLCTISTRNNAVKRFPGEVVPGILYLGDWADAEAHERLDELNIKRVLTIHNNPENLRLPARFQRLTFELADVDTQDVSPFFAPSYDFIEGARAAREAVLVHCGAGVSRSAALVIAYLMRRFTWPAERAREHCRARRSLVNPNQGFWRQLCAIEAQLGITQRSDPTATTDFHGLDAAPVVLAPGAAGERVAVAFVAAGSGGAAGAASSSQHAANGAANGGGGGGGARAQDEGGREARRRRSAEADGRERRRAGSPGRGRGEGEEEGRGRRQGGRDAERGADRDRRRGRDEDGDRAALRDREEREDRRGRRHSRSRSAQRGGGARDRDGDRHRERRNRHEDAEPDGRPVKRRREASPAGGMREEDEGALGGASADTPEQAPAPGVVLEVRREGKLVGNLELGLREAKDKVVIGRAPGCDIVLEHLSISRQHAELTTDLAGNLFLTDLGAAHRTNIDGVWIRPNVARQLAVGATVRFGASTREYKVLQVPRSLKT